MKFDDQHILQLGFWHQPENDDVMQVIGSFQMACVLVVPKLLRIILVFWVLQQAAVRQVQWWNHPIGPTQLLSTVVDGPCSWWNFPLQWWQCEVPFPLMHFSSQCFKSISGGALWLARKIIQHCWQLVSMQLTERFFRLKICNRKQKRKGHQRYKSLKCCMASNGKPGIVQPSLPIVLILDSFLV